MKKFLSLAMTVVLLTVIVFSFTGAQTDNTTHLSLTVSADNISYALSSNLYGLSLDGIDYALNGGLVAQYVNNNSFEQTDNSTANWVINGVDYSVSNENGMNENNQNYLSVTVNGNGTIKNTGYSEIYNNNSFQYSSKKAQTADMGFVEDESYLFSAYFKNVDYEGTMTLSLDAKGNTEKYQFNIDNCNEWTKVSLEIKSNVTGDGALKIDFEGNGSFYMDSVSLVPTSSYGYNSENWKYTSLRQDLVDAIKGLSPSFIRFSEVSVVDESTGDRSGWKSTVGSLEARKQVSVNFNDDQIIVNSNAMGFYEYLVLCEELNAVPVPVFNIGYVTDDDSKLRIVSQQVAEQNEEELADTDESTDSDEAVEEAINPDVQNVLDFIEYATGDETTVWGAKRVADGHSEPFAIEYIVLDAEALSGNYWESFSEIYNAVGEKYPKIQVISGSGDALDGVLFETTWKNVKTDYNGAVYNCALINEYFGGKKVSLYDNVERYDFYERSGPKVVVDSFYSNADGIGSVITANNIWSALENSAFLLSLEKNADLVEMASYKTTLAKKNAQLGEQSLIWFDSQDILLTSDYYAQMLFSNNRGTNYVSTDFDMEDDGIYQSTTVDTVKKVIYVKLVNTTNRSHKIDISVEGFKNANSPSVQYMTEKFKSAYNNFDEPLHSAPTQSELTLENDTISYEMGSYSVSVVRIPYSTNDGTRLYELPEIDIISPYIHPAVEYAFPILLVSLILITGLVILVERIMHHKSVKKNEE